MIKLFSRDSFREAIFKRDNYTCIICGEIGKYAHHIMERRLFDDGGYYIDNGATLCEKCHILAEQTVLSTGEIRNKAGIQKTILPPHLYEDYEYDKWGNIINANGTRVKGELFYDESVQKILNSANILPLFKKYIKYPRTYHLPFSLGRTSDDKIINNCNYLLSENIVVTEKLDGENTTCYSDGYIHARSLDGNNHPSRDWVKNYLTKICYELPDGWRICGENVYAKHSIHYINLESYFYLFSIWNEKNECLSWEETEEWAALLNLNLVPILFKGKASEEILKQLYKPNLNGNECEGFVVRHYRKFTYGEFRKCVAKFVRPNHVRTNTHWIKTKIKPNLLK